MLVVTSHKPAGKKTHQNREHFFGKDALSHTEAGEDPDSKSLSPIPDMAEACKPPGEMGIGTRASTLSSRSNKCVRISLVPELPGDVPSLCGNNGGLDTEFEQDDDNKD